jgi:hypothetical protein
MKSLLSILVFLVLLTAVQNRFEPPEKQSDMKILNQLITNRDRRFNRMFYRVTYQELVEYESQLKALKMLQAINKQQKNQEDNTQKPPPEIFLPNDQKNVKPNKLDQKAKVPQKKPAMTKDAE